MAKKKTTYPKKVEALSHTSDSRVNIPTAEYQAVMQDEHKAPIRVEYERRNQDLDPQLIWRGKYEQDQSDFVVQAPPLYIQEKVHPKVLIDDLRRQSEQADDVVGEEAAGYSADLFADFNGLPDENAKTEFYRHDANWSNRMILGDSLQVMASLTEREGLRGKVQCIYIDPPYGIKFNSNFQWSTTSRDVKDGKTDHITREPEQVKAFRDTWRDGIHSYLTYLRDRLTVARDLLTDSGSVFVQIGDENVHRVRALMDEVFGEENFVSEILYRRGGFQTSGALPNTFDFIVWFAKDRGRLKSRSIYIDVQLSEWFSGQQRWVEKATGEVARFNEPSSLGLGDVVHSQRAAQSASSSEASIFPVHLNGKKYFPSRGRGWSTSELGYSRLKFANRLLGLGNSLRFKPYFHDFPYKVLTNGWFDTVASGFGDEKTYVVQTSSNIIQRCVLMTTDPGDLVLDPTCGSGTTAYVAEQWGRRWITIDTSRVALALARSRIMGARYPYYLLADSKEGQIKEADLSQTVPSEQPTGNSVRQGFVYDRVPHITLKSIANNAEIDVIWEKWQEELEPLRKSLNKSLKQSWEEWEIPREAEDGWTAKTKETHEAWWKARIARQQEIDASIAAKADFEYLYDKPYEDKKKVRVAGPFTVDSISPHRAMITDADGAVIDPAEQKGPRAAEQDFVQIIMENLKTAGVQQAHKQDKIDFISLEAWPGKLVCAEGTYDDETGKQKRAAILIGPEFGTLSRPDLVEAAKEAADCDFDVLVSCAFNYEAHASELDSIGRIPVLKARINADMHMAEDLKNTGKGNLFVIFGEPDIDILEVEGDQYQVKINGVDVFHPIKGEVISDGADGIACWFIDTDYNEESFFVRHAYFLGANDPYKALRTTLKAEINAEAWETLHSDTSRPFDKPTSGRIAVKVINHLGDEVMKVYRVN